MDLGWNLGHIIPSNGATDHSFVDLKETKMDLVFIQIMWSHIDRAYGYVKTLSENTITCDTRRACERNQNTRMLSRFCYAYRVTSRHWLCGWFPASNPTWGQVWEVSLAHTYRQRDFPMHSAQVRLTLMSGPWWKL